MFSYILHNLVIRRSLLISEVSEGERAISDLGKILEASWRR